MPLTIWVRPQPDGSLPNGLAPLFRDKVVSRAMMFDWWRNLEPRRGTFDFTNFDAAIAALRPGEILDYGLTGGPHAPDWVAQAGVPTLSFYAAGVAGWPCGPVSVYATWTPAYLALYEDALAALAKHAATSGTMARIGAIENAAMSHSGSGEVGLPSLGCRGHETTRQIAARYAEAGYRPQLMVAGWQRIMTAIDRSFPRHDKAQCTYDNVAAVFPRVGTDGRIIRKAADVVPVTQLMFGWAAARWGHAFDVRWNGIQPGELVSGVMESAVRMRAGVGGQLNMFARRGAPGCGRRGRTKIPACTPQELRQLIDAAARAMPELRDIQVDPAGLAILDQGP